MQDYARVSAGNTEITADWLNRLMADLRRQRRVLAVPPLEMVPTPAGHMLRLPGQAGFWARLTGHLAGGRYAFVELAVAARAGEGRDAPAGLADAPRPRTEATHDLVEQGSCTDVPADAVVWAVPADDGQARPRLLFRAPLRAAAPDRSVFWARLDGSATVAGVTRWGYVEQSLTDAGTFEDAPFGRAAGPTEPAAAVEASLAAGLADGTVVLLVLGRGGGLGGGTQAGLAAPDDAPVFVAGGAAAGRWAMLVPRPGAAAGGGDEPLVSAAGGYSWVALVPAGDGTLTADPDSGHSAYPLGLAYDADGRTTVPAGTVVWLESGPTVRVPLADLADHVAALGMTEAEYAAALEADPAAAVTDTRQGFRFAGQAGFWARLTGGATADAAGRQALYPFEVVRAAGGPAPGDGPADATALAAAVFPAAGVYAPSAAPDAAPAAAAGDLAWVAAAPGGQAATGVAAEAGGRGDLPAGTVVFVVPVQLWRGGAAVVGAAFRFTGPPAGLWAAITGPADESGGYPWEELYPGADPATGDPLPAATGVAWEAAGNPAVPAGAAVLLRRAPRHGVGDAPAADTELAAADGGGPWYFAHAAGPQVRVVRYLGGGQASADATGLGDAAETLAVTGWPHADWEDYLVVGCHYAAFWVAGAGAAGGWVIPVGVGPADDDVSGLVTAGTQLFQEDLAFGDGVAVEADVADGDLPATTAQFFAFDPATGTTATARVPRGVVGLESLRLEGGPRLDAAPGFLDLQDAVYAPGSTDALAGVQAVPLPGDGTASITTDGGLFVEADVSLPTNLWSGTFVMDSGPSSPPGAVTVTVVDGLVVSIV